MTPPTIQGLNPAGTTQVLQLNNKHAAETSYLTEDEWHKLLAESFYACGIEGGVAAFLIALDQTATYENPTSFGSSGTATALFTLTESLLPLRHAARDMLSACTRTFARKPCKLGTIGSFAK